VEAYFDSNDVVRLQCRRETTDSVPAIGLLRWSLRTGKVGETGRFGNVLSVGDRQAGHLLVATDQGGLDVRNAETGQLERAILPPSPYRAQPGHGWTIQPRFLADGGVAAIVRDEHGDHLKTFPSAGGMGVDVPLGSRRALLVGETVAGEVLLETWNDSEFASLFVDASSGQVLRESGLRPVVWRWRTDLRNESVPGSLETRLFLTLEGALIERDPVTGARRVVVQGQEGQGGM
jgi:hypothetical protein